MVMTISSRRYLWGSDEGRQIFGL